MGRSDSGIDAYPIADNDELPEHDATIGSFSLDTFEITVGRFRNFVEGYPANTISFKRNQRKYDCTHSVQRAT